MYYVRFVVIFFFFKQKTAYEMRISDWSSACALPVASLIQPVALDQMINGAFTAKLAFEQAELVKNERLAGKSRMKRQKIVNRPRRAVEAGGGDMRQISAQVRRGTGGRSGEGRVGEEGGSTVRVRWSAYEYKK